MYSGGTRLWGKEEWVLLFVEDAPCFTERWCFFPNVGLLFLLAVMYENVLESKMNVKGSGQQDGICLPKASWNSWVCASNCFPGRDETKNKKERSGDSCFL